MGRIKGAHHKNPHPYRLVIRRCLRDYPPPTPLKTPCRLTQGSLSGEGYGRRWDPDLQKLVLLHRWIWEQINGPVPEGMVLMHQCDHPICYRYDHLKLGTYKDNSKDMIAKGRGRGQFEANKSYPWSRLTKSDVDDIRVRLVNGETLSEISRRYGVHRSTILGIRDGKYWKWWV
jgi:HNH endonuclease